MNRNTYDLVAIDVDGTLLDSQHEISVGAADAIQRASTAGLQLVLVSGRSLLLLRDYMLALDVTPYYIGSGGACVGTLDGEILELNPISRKTGGIITFAARQENLGVCFHEASQQKCEIEDPDMRRNLDKISQSKIDFVADVLQSTHTAPEKITIFGPRNRLEGLKTHLDSLELPISTTFSGPNYLEVTRAGVSKGNALRSLAKHLGIHLDCVAAIGDQQNDVSMFQAVGLAVAMGNAPDEVKSFADLVAPTNDAGGLAWALRQLTL